MPNEKLISLKLVLKEQKKSMKFTCLPNNTAYNLSVQKGFYGKA